MAERELRRQLAGLRRQALDALISGGVESTMLALLQSTTAGLDALDRLRGASTHAARALVADDGDTMRLILCAGAGGERADMPLTRAAAIDLAGELLKAVALRELLDAEGERRAEAEIAGGALRPRETEIRAKGSVNPCRR